jgi:hypothetical protein
MHVRARYKKLGAHFHVRVFVGKDRHTTHALAGELVLDEEEFDEFKNSAQWMWMNYTENSDG